MATSMPTTTADMSDMTSIGIAAMATLAARDATPRNPSQGYPSHSRTSSHPHSQPHSYTYAQPHSHSHSRSQSQSESYHQSQQQEQQYQQHHQQQPSRSSLHSRPRDITEDSINASGVFPPPPFVSERPTSASHDYYKHQHQHQHQYQYQYHGQQREQRSSSPSAVHNFQKMAAARRPLPSNSSAPASTSSHSKPPSRRPSASSASPNLSTSYRDRMGEAESNSRGASSAAKTHYIATDSNDAMDAPRDEIIVGSSNSLRASPANITIDHEDTIMGDGDSPAQPKRKRSTTTNSEAVETLATNNGAPTVPRASGSPANTKVEVSLGYWRESTVPDVKDRHAIVGFIDTVGRLRTRIVQTTRYGAAIPLEFERPSGTGSSWMTFEGVVFESHLIGLDHNQVKEYVKIRTEAAGVSETPEEKAIIEKAAVIEAKRRATAHPASDNQQTPQIAYGLDLPDFITMHSNGGRAEKKRRATNNYAPALSPENDATPKSTPPPSGNPAAANGNGNGNGNSNGNGNGEIAPTRSPSVFSAIQRSAIDLLPGTRPAKILVGYWRGSSEERIDDKHAVLGILGANDMFRVKVTRQTRDGRPVLGNFPVGAGALWINYDEVEFEQHIRHLSRPEMKEYVRVRQRQLDEGEKPTQRHENETAAVYEAQSRVLKAGGAAQSTLGNAGRVNTISFATAARLELEPARVAEMNEANKNHETAVHNGQAYDSISDTPQRRGSSGHEFRQSRRSTMDQPEDAAAIAAAAIAAAAGTSSTTRSTGRPSVSDVSIRNDSSSNPNAKRIERTHDIARREITRIESLQQRNEQRAGASFSSSSNGATTGVTNGNENGAPPVLPSQQSSGSANGANGGTSARQSFQENIGRLNKVWASQEASRLRADGEDAKIFRGVKYERKQTGPFQGKLVSPGTILSIDGEDYVEYRVLTKPTFF